jgi:hypothetical protein
MEFCLEEDTKMMRGRVVFDSVVRGRRTGESSSIRRCCAEWGDGELLRPGSDSIRPVGCTHQSG